MNQTTWIDWRWFADISVLLIYCHYLTVKKSIVCEGVYIKIFVCYIFIYQNIMYVLATSWRHKNSNRQRIFSICVILLEILEEDVIRMVIDWRNKITFFSTCFAIQHWFALLLVDCLGHYWNELTACVFINLHIVSRPPTDLCTPIGTFLLQPNVNLSLLINLRWNICTFYRVTSQ